MERAAPVHGGVGQRRVKVDRRIFRSDEPVILIVTSPTRARRSTKTLSS